MTKYLASGLLAAVAGCCAAEPGQDPMERQAQSVDLSKYTEKGQYDALEQKHIALLAKHENALSELESYRGDIEDELLALATPHIEAADRYLKEGNDEAARKEYRTIIKLAEDYRAEQKTKEDKKQDKGEKPESTPKDAPAKKPEAADDTLRAELEKLKSAYGTLEALLKANSAKDEESLKNTIETLKLFSSQIQKLEAKKPEKKQGYQRRRE